MNPTKTFSCLLLVFASAFVFALGDQADSRPTSKHQAKQPWKGPSKDMQSAVFAGGCFWCMESAFETVPGVAEVLSGYTGGELKSPSYKTVGKGKTGHTEAIQVFFFPEIISYQTLLDFYWRQFDPTDANGSFVDRGSQYRSGIFTADETQAKLAKASKANLIANGPFKQPIVTPIEPLKTFWLAEEHHQDYYLKQPEHYSKYRKGSGRDQFCDKIWGAGRQLNFGPLLTTPKARFHKPSDKYLKRWLSPMAYKVTQKDATERAFNNEYWDNKEQGIYVDIVSGEPLFSSAHKFKSGTGWPSFWKPLIKSNISTGVDHKLSYPRNELRSAHADSHLGHVFDDGPEPSGKRYCINSAALRFIPKDKLTGEGYGQFQQAFTDR